MEIIRKDESTWIIEDTGVRVFILKGKEKTAVIDTGMNLKDLKDIVSGLTDQPLILLNTHADRDHIGCNGEFDEVSIGIHELQHYQKNGFSQKITALYENDEIDLGERKLIVVDLSGHTPGSIGFYDPDRKILISGDPIQKDGRVYMFGEQRSLTGYIASLERLQKRKEDFKEIWPSHATLPLDNGSIGKCLKDVKDICAGVLDYELIEMFGTTARAYKGKENIYLCDNR